MSEEPFLRGEAHLRHHRRSLAHEPRVGDVVAEHRCVGRHGLAAWATDKHMHWLTEPFSLQVPQRVVNHRDCHHRLALPAVHRCPMHDVPQELGGQGVAPDQQVAQLPNVPRNAGKHSAADARYARVGIDLHKDLLHLESPRVELLPTRMDVAANPKLIVDVGRLQEPVLKERSVNGHASGKVSQSDVCDVHVGV